MSRAALDFVNLRARMIAASCAGVVVSCGSEPRAGLVTAPLLASSVTVIAPQDAGPDVLTANYRPLPEEPKAPANQQGCRREVECDEPDDEEAISWPFPPPFDHCSPTLGRAEQKFSAAETTQRRKQEGSTTCCYVEFQGCYSNRGYSRPVPGRPLRDDEGQMLLPEIAEQVEDRFVAIGKLEHASVASFSQLSLDLLALGAPSTLIEAVHRAALDEIAHAELAFAIAHERSGQRITVSRMPIAMRATPTLVSLARETLRDGCINETLAAAEGACERDSAQTDRERAFFTRVAEDEATHAELAFRIIAWAIGKDPSILDVLEADARSLVSEPVVREVVLPALAAMRTS